MPIAARTFRVFVSSTFEDLKEERNALQREVFPKLRTLCEQHGARFQAIDLRWGVRDEAALDQQTMTICLREIQRCKATGVRPNFIALLGDRYGWRPLPVTISASEFEALKPHLSERDAEVALQWYRLDENAVPPEYCLQPRTGQFVKPSAWKPVEESLVQALATAARAGGLSEEELIKYEASATHQEILAALGETGEDRQHVFGFVQRPNGNTDPRLEALKSHLRSHEFDAGDMKALCELVLSQLTQVIEQEVKRFEVRPALDLEIEAHDRFAEDRCRIFTGRETELDRIAEYISGPYGRPLLLDGESGSGKSALLAKASQQYNGPGRVIRRFIGASPEPAGFHALLTSLCRQIAPGEPPVDYAQLQTAFQERLSTASEEQRLVLFIDAADQLAADGPAWLPNSLPPHVRIIVSGTWDPYITYNRLVMQVGRMTELESGQALDESLRESRRNLRPWQRETVLAHFERCGLPLYLKLAAEESKLWKSYTPEDACTLREGVTGVIDTLFDRLASNANHGPTLVERSLGYLAAARYGLTENEVLDVLTADDAVWNDFDQRKRHEVNERRLPVVVWSRLSLDLEPYLTKRDAPGGTVMTLSPRQLAECVTGRFLGGAESEARHRNLAHYFSARPVHDTRRAAEMVIQQRGAHEWAEAEATLLDVQFLFAKVAAGMVLDLDADYEVLLQDAPASALPEREALRLVHGALRLSMHVVAQHPAQFASQTVGRLLGHRDKPAIAKFVDEITTTASRPWLRPLHPCLDSPGGALLRTLKGHSDAVSSVAMTPDGEWAVSGSWDKTLKVWDLETGRGLLTLEGHSDCVQGVAVIPNGSFAFSASWGGTLRMWDLASGREYGAGGAGGTARAHSSFVNGVAVTPDWEQMVSASSDKTLKVWRTSTGLRTLEGHTGAVNGVALTADGKRAVSASSDKTLKVWDLDTGRALYTLEGHSDDVLGVAVTANGKRAVSASRDGTLKVWDLETSACLRTLTGHSDDVYGVAMTADGKRAVSASRDRTLKVWDPETGACLRTFEGHSDAVLAVAITAGGERAVSASADGTLKVWDLVTDHVSRAPEGHGGPVNGLAVTVEGKRAVSASDDKTLKVWDLETGYALRTLEDRWVGYYAVCGVAVTPDGKQAVYTSADRTLKMWNLDTGTSWRVSEGHRISQFFCIVGVGVTGDGKRAVSASDWNTLKVWDLETFCAQRTLEGHFDVVTGVAVAPDGERAVSASQDKTLKVWDLQTGRALHTLEGHTDIVWGVALTANTKRAVSACQDKTLKVWDLDTGRMLRTLEAHSGPVYGVAVTPDGKRVVSASEDKTLKFWDLDAGLLVATFHCDAPARCCACAAPNLIIAGDEGGRVYFLALEE